MSKSIKILEEWKALIQNLPNEQRLQFWDIIMGFTDETYSPVIEDSRIKGVYEFILPTIIKEHKKHTALVAHAKSIGKNGGRPKSETAKPKAEKKERIIAPIPAPVLLEVPEKYPFMDFWNLYDKKVDQGSCERKWAKINQHDRELIMAHVKLYVEAVTDKEFRKNPHSYLTKKRWLDEIIPTGEKVKRMSDIEKLAYGK